jgi:hypothetical protein
MLPPIPPRRHQEAAGLVPVATRMLFCRLGSPLLVCATAAGCEIQQEHSARHPVEEDDPRTRPQEIMSGTFMGSPCWKMWHLSQMSRNPIRTRS